MKLKHIAIRYIPSVAKRIAIKPTNLKLPTIDLDHYLGPGPSDRTMATERAYRKYRRSATFKGCVFCDPAEVAKGTTYKHFVVVPTKFKYEIWDDHLVDEHLLLIPRRHVVQIHEFNEAEKAEYLTLLGQYEHDGYSIYSRAPSDAARSVTHFHTHFIKLHRQAIRSMLYINKPHIMLYQKRK